MLRRIKAHNYYFKEILALFFLLLAAYFFKQQRSEIAQASQILGQSQAAYITFGLALTALYILLQAMMYVYAFQAVQMKVSLASASKLFLKRNLISVFLPGGGITSLAFFTEELESKGISKTKIAYASFIVGIIGFVSLILIALPVIAYLSIDGKNMSSNWWAIVGLSLFILSIIFITRSFINKGWVYHKLYRINPQFESILFEIKQSKIHSSKIFCCLACSIAIEITGICHIYVAMLALGLSPQMDLAMAGYIIATLFYAISPFLRGLGAVEVSLVMVLQSYGLSQVDALSVTILYRFFEFWAPLAAGIAAFFFARGNILLRLFPALLLATLGVINMISVLTPPLLDRIHFLKQYLTLDLIHFSNLAVLGLGVMLLACSAFLLKGLKNAWRIALVLSVGSLLGHLVKGVDYEEASLALVSIFVLWFTRKNYRLKNDPKVQYFGIHAALIILAAAMLYGLVGFYFLDKQHFNTEFSITKAAINTLQSFFLLDTSSTPVTRFASWFIHSINTLGIISLSLLLYSFVKPYIFRQTFNAEDRLQAQDIAATYGQTADDYFKMYPDKYYYFASKGTGFVAYKIASGFAFALGEPVCEPSEKAKRALLVEFDTFCYDNGLKSVYYKVDETNIPLFQDLKKKTFHIGQEALVDVQTFTLEGKDKKSLRNSLNNLEKKGFKTIVYAAPIKDGLLQKLQQVSDEWLSSMNRKEIVFSSGLFDWDELKMQSVITVENADEKVVAFLNIIPSYSNQEGTYDLIRRAADAPSGVMDALIIAFIKILKEENKQFLNMGMAVMSGLEKPKDLPEWTLKFAYEKLGQFKGHHGLFEFKDKYNPIWKSKFLMYDNHYDLVSIPVALGKISKQKP